MILPKRILITRLSAMGDVAMVIPVIIAFTRAYPEVKIFMLSRLKFKPLFKGISQVTFVQADVDGKHKGLSGLYRLSREINLLQIDAFADFHNVLRTIVIRNMIFGVPSSVIDKGRKEKQKLVEDRNFFQPLKHTTERYADVLRDLGFKFDLSHNEFLQRKQLNDNILKFTGAKTSKWIGFAPFAAHKPKSLTTDRAKKIIKRLSREFDVKIILIGGGSKEKKKLQIAAATTADVVNMTGKFSFEDELSLISNLDAMIAMDSGNGHLASLYNIPVISLWGNTHPYAGFTPYAQAEQNQLTPDIKVFPKLPTSIFGNKRVEGYVKAANSIKIQTILARLREVFEERI